MSHGEGDTVFICPCGQLVKVTPGGPPRPMLCDACLRANQAAAPKLRQVEYMTDPEVQELMQALACAVERTALRLRVEPLAYAIIVYNDPAFNQYISNLPREIGVRQLRDTADELEARRDQ